MNLLASFAPQPTSLQVGIRAVCRAGRRSLVAPHSGLCRSIWLSTQASIHSPRSVLNTSSAFAKVRLRRNGITRNQTRHLFTRIAYHYVDLPNGYEDHLGTPWRAKELTDKEAVEIFGPHISAKAGEKLLRILHGRRVAGTLSDPSTHPNTKTFSAADQKKALEFLRRTTKVNEIVNAGLRAEDELKAIDLGISYAELRRNGPAPEGSAEAGSSGVATDSEKPPPPGPESNSPYGQSVIDRIRARNIAKYEAEQRLKEEERKKHEEVQLQNTGTLQSQDAIRPRAVSPVVKKWTERATSDLEAPPELKSWERLLPSAAFTLLLVVGSLAYATIYHAPNKDDRLWPDIPPAAATVLALVGINLAIWGMWKVPHLWPLFNRYLLVVPATPKPFAMFAAMFSHQNLGHLTINMLTLWLFGVRLHDEVGRGNFLAIYLCSGAVGFLTSMVNLVLFRGLHYTTLGASGAIYGVMVAFFWLHRFDEFKILGFPPDPVGGIQGLGFIGLILGMHVIGALSKSGHNLDLASHMGGIAAGLAGAELWKRRTSDGRIMMKTEQLKKSAIDAEKVIEKK